MSKARGRSSEGRYAYPNLDLVIHERARLSLMTSLVAHPKGLRFSDLKRLCDLTDGNLSRHLQLLAAENLVAVSKSYEDSRPQTWCRLTAEGRRRYVRYLSVLEQIVEDSAARNKSGDALFPSSAGH
ncbi:MAG TPA: transcriptional regulator [Steroidobacteraceae bacterium]|jgi:DNA-binding MarR family transcriptional regulator